MKIVKAKFKDRSGKTCTSKKWYCDFFDHKGRRHKLAGFTDRRATEALSQNIMALIDCRASGGSLKPDQQKWIDRTPEYLIKNFVRWGLLSSERAEGSKLLLTHLADWRKSLEANGTKKNADLKFSRVKRIFDSCGFSSLRHISASKIQLCISGLKKISNRKENGKICPVETNVPISQRTQHHILTACKQFTRWAKADGRTAENPLEYLKPVTVTETQIRADYSADEIRTLLSFTEDAERRFKMSGYERCLLYRLACQSGLRADELRHLTAGCFDLEKMTVILPGKFTKNKQDAVLPLRTETAEMFKEYLFCKLPTARVFAMPSKGNVSKMIHKDLEQARQAWLKQTGQQSSDFLAIENDRGKRDFHSLRHSFASMLAATGTHPKTAQQLLRHSKIDLTMSIYTHSLRDKETSAIASLPDLDILPESQKQKMTGTDNQKVDVTEAICFHRCFNKNTAEHSKTLHLSAKQGATKPVSGNSQKATIQAQKPRFSAENGEAGIRTPDTGVNPYDGLANRCLKPLGHLSKHFNIKHL